MGFCDAVEGYFLNICNYWGMFQFGFSSIRPRPFCTIKAYSLQLTAFVKSHFADEERSFIYAPAFLL